MILVLLSIVCFIIFVHFVKATETKTSDGWVPLKLPLWIWTIVVVTCLVPLLNIIALLIFEVLFVTESLDSYPCIRFKKKVLLLSIIELMQREF